MFNSAKYMCPCLRQNALHGLNNFVASITLGTAGSRVVVLVVVDAVPVLLVPVRRVLVDRVLQNKKGYKRLIKSPKCHIPDIRLLSQIRIRAFWVLLVQIWRGLVDRLLHTGITGSLPCFFLTWKRQARHSISSFCQRSS